jgi:hypothetical protein
MQKTTTIMDLSENLIEPLFERVEAYAQTTLELSKLKAVQMSISAATALLSGLGVLFSLLLFVLILSVGSALYLGEMLGKPCYGFFVVATFFLFLGIVLHLFLSQWLRKSVGDFIVKNLLQPTEPWKT